jgi:outer membrane protein
VADFQHKLQNNAFLSRERAEKEQQRLAKKEQELQELEAKLTQDIMLENQKLNMQLADSLTNFLNVYNADGRYHLILSNNAKDNVLWAAEMYDITDEVVAGLNARYKTK